MKGFAPAIAILAVWFASLPSLAEDVCAEPVRTQSGMVRGMSHLESEVCAWHGIPYAAPPVGQLRFRSPEPPPAWDGVRDAYFASDKCMQRDVAGTAKVRGKHEGMSEECLYLNVFRPRKSGVFPVMVWIHGGGYVIGSGNEYRGDRLADFGDVVVVTINYRLGVFGYFATPTLREEDGKGRTGGQGALDQVAALKWVHDNIANFGGDPANVTIFGESAGGWAVCTMIATPLANGLFHRAIMQSQGCRASEDLESGYERAALIAQKVGCRADDVSCLRALPAEDLVNLGMDNPLAEGFVYLPHYDGALLNKAPIDHIRGGDFNRVPFLAGHTRDELDFVLFLVPELYNSPPWQYEDLARENLGLSGPELQRFLELYPVEKYRLNNRKALRRVVTDAGIACPTYMGLDAVSRQEGPVYYYRFDYDKLTGGRWIGALHSTELYFVFNTVSDVMLYQNRHLPEAQGIARVMMGYWTNFAKTGNPNGDPLPPWPQFDPSNPQVQILDSEVRTENADMFDRCTFWDGYEQTHPLFTQSLGRAQKK